MFLISSSTLDLLNRDIHAMPTLRGDEFTVDSLVFCKELLQMLVQVRVPATPIAVPSLPVAAHSPVGAGDSLHAGFLDKVEVLWRS